MQKKAAEFGVNWQEFLLTHLIKLAGYSAIIIVGVIFYFLLNQGIPTIIEVPISSLFSDRWYPVEGYFGLLPLIWGSLVVTLTATIIAIPVGLSTAIFISEIAPDWARELLKPIVEVLGGIPSVVLGFIGILVFAPNIGKLLKLPTGLSALTGAILLAAMSLPTIVSIGEDALDAVPKSLRDASIALGATEWQTIWFVTLPAARSGVITAFMLGIGRTIGETMTVMMVTGNAPTLFETFGSIFSPVRTMTATIAAEMGEVATASIHYHVLFFIGILLFIFSLIINISASAIMFRKTTRAERLLS